MQHYQYQIEFNEEKDLLEQSVQQQTMKESQPGSSGQSNINCLLYTSDAADE